MPKIQKKIKRRYNSTTSETIQEAIDLINTGKLSINQCCKEFDIPKGTLINRLHDNHFRNVGRPTVLSSKEEEVIANFLITVSNWGYPFSSSEIKAFVKAYLDNENRTIERFKDNLPGDEWVQNSLSRSKKKITKRFCQNLKSSKAKLSREAVSCYFDQLKVSLTGSDGRPIQPERIFNYDETNLTDDPGVRKFIFKRGIKYPDRILDTTKSSISVMFCGSATGKLLPPYVVYQASNLWDTWVKGGPARTRYNRTKSGWFDSTCFKDWFLNYNLSLESHVTEEIVIANSSPQFSNGVDQVAEQIVITNTTLESTETAGQGDSSKEDDDDTEEITEEELFALVMEARI